MFHIENENFAKLCERFAKSDTTFRSFCKNFVKINLLYINIKKLCEIFVKPKLVMWSNGKKLALVKYVAKLCDCFAKFLAKLCKTLRLFRETLFTGSWKKRRRKMFHIENENFAKLCERFAKSDTTFRSFCKNFVKINLLYINIKKLCEIFVKPKLVMWSNGKKLALVKYVAKLCVFFAKTQQNFACLSQKKICLRETFAKIIL